MKLLAGYGKALFDQLRLANVVLRLKTENVVDATLAIDVAEECEVAEQDAHSAQSILWEHLEEPALCQWASWITVVVVSRQFQFSKTETVAEHVQSTFLNYGLVKPPK